MHPKNARCCNFRSVLTGLILPLLLTAILPLWSVQRADAQKTYRYSAADRSLLLRTAKQEQKAIAAYDRRGMIRLAQVYEGVWKKYKDTSLQAALRCYRFACLTEGDMSDYQLPVAYRLARIYDQGKLVPRNLDDAMAYYLLSGEKGKKRLQQLRDSVCQRGQITYMRSGDFSAGDSVVLQISPFCRNLHPETRYTLQRLANQMRSMPGWSLHLRADFAYPVIAAPYNLMTVKAMWEFMQVLQNFLVEQEGISGERLQAEPAEPVAGAEQGFRVVLKLEEIKSERRHAD